MHINWYVLGTWKGVNLLLFMTASSNNVVYFHMYLWNRVVLSHKWWCINLQKCLKSVREKKKKKTSHPHFLFSFLVHFWDTLLFAVIVAHAIYPSISILSSSSSEDAMVNPCDFDLIRVVSVQMAVSLHPSLFYQHTFASLWLT